MQFEGWVTPWQTTISASRDNRGLCLLGLAARIALADDGDKVPALFADLFTGTQKPEPPPAAQTAAPAVHGAQLRHAHVAVSRGARLHSGSTSSADPPGNLPQVTDTSAMRAARPPCRPIAPVTDDSARSSGKTAARLPAAHAPAADSPAIADRPRPAARGVEVRHERLKQFHASHPLATTGYRLDNARCAPVARQDAAPKTPVLDTGRFDGAPSCWSPRRRRRPILNRSRWPLFSSLATAGSVSPAANGSECAHGSAGPAAQRGDDPEPQKIVVGKEGHV